MGAKYALVYPSNPRHTILSKVGGRVWIMIPKSIEFDFLKKVRQ